MMGPPPKTFSLWASSVLHVTNNYVFKPHSTQLKKLSVCLDPMQAFPNLPRFQNWIETCTRLCLIFIMVLKRISWILSQWRVEYLQFSGQLQWLKKIDYLITYKPWSLNWLLFLRNQLMVYCCSSVKLNETLKPRALQKMDLKFSFLINSALHAGMK